ncbi:MAG: hypothetical protein ACYDER_12145 [Ktedonobacteraceae bacterium]
MSSEEQQGLRTILREELGSLRGIIREDIDAAIHASEQRTNERFDRIDGRLDRMDERFDRIDGRLDRIEATQKQMQVDYVAIKIEIADLRRELVQAISVLDEATIKINELLRSQHTLETKVEENILSLRRDMFRAYELIKSNGKDFLEATRAMVIRLELHENTTIDKAHPRPYSAA